jgi:hypothetical protein
MRDRLHDSPGHTESPHGTPVTEPWRSVLDRMFPMQNALSDVLNFGRGERRLAELTCGTIAGVWDNPPRELMRLVAVTTPRRTTSCPSTTCERSLRLVNCCDPGSASGALPS